MKKKTKNNINDFKDRMTAPMSIVMTNPKTRKPQKATKTAAKKGK